MEALVIKEKEFLEKVDKRRSEVERLEKKFASVSSVKPAFLEELERQEKELERLFQIYADKIRNLDYLEQRFTQISMHEMEKQGQIKRYLEKM